MRFFFSIILIISLAYKNIFHRAIMFRMLANFYKNLSLSREISN